MSDEPTDDTPHVCEACGEETDELTEVVSEFMTHDHPGVVLMLCPTCAWDGI
jgi:hypothetical protein